MNRSSRNSLTGTVAVTFSSPDKRQQIHERFALGSPARVRNLMNFQPIDLPGVREEQERLVCGRGEQGHDKIFFLDSHSDFALAAAPLRPIQGNRIALNVPGVRDRDDHFFIRDHVFQGNLGFFFHDLRATIVVVGLAHLDQLILDDRTNQRFAAKDRLETLDLLQDLRIFLDEFVALQLRKPLEPHLQNRIRLDFAQRKLRIRPTRASSGDCACRIKVITASRLSSAILSPSRIWARSSALRNSNTVRRTTISRRCSMK